MDALGCTAVTTLVQRHSYFHVTQRLSVCLSVFICFSCMGRGFRVLLIRCLAFNGRSASRHFVSFRVFALHGRNGWMCLWILRLPFFLLVVGGCSCYELIPLCFHNCFVSFTSRLFFLLGRPVARWIYWNLRRLVFWRLLLEKKWFLVQKGVLFW